MCIALWWGAKQQVLLLCSLFPHPDGLEELSVLWVMGPQERKHWDPKALHESEAAF